MKVARRALSDPDRIKDLEQEMNDRVTELLGEATDAGYSTSEALAALAAVVANQGVILGADPDPADDP